MQLREGRAIRTSETRDEFPRLDSVPKRVPDRVVDEVKLPPISQVVILALECRMLIKQVEQGVLPTIGAPHKTRIFSFTCGTACGRASYDRMTPSGNCSHAPVKSSYPSVTADGPRLQPPKLRCRSPEPDRTETSWVLGSRRSQSSVTDSNSRPLSLGLLQLLPSRLLVLEAVEERSALVLL